MMSNSRTWNIWAIRKVRQGRVKFHGYWYYADNTYDGTLDNIWMVFYSYKNYTSVNEWYFSPYICPWGTLEYYQSTGEEKSRLFRESPLWDSNRKERWHMWFPCRSDALKIVNSIPDRSMQREFVIRLFSVLLPGLSNDEQWIAVDWHYRDIFPSYNRVHTYPHEYQNATIIKGLQ